MSKFYDWTKRYGKVNEHNAARAPRPLAGSLGAARRSSPSMPSIPLEGYRRLTYMMMDADRGRRQPGHRLPRAEPGRLLRSLESHRKARQRPGISAAACAPRALARRHQLRQRLRHVLLPDQRAGRLQPVHRPLGTAREHDRRPTSRSSCNEPGKSSPAATPRIITDNGPQFIAKDFKEFIRLCGMTHVRDQPLLSAEQRQDRTLARHAQARLPAASRAAVARGGATTRRRSSSTHYNHVRLHRPSATSRPPTSWPAASRRSSPSAIRSSPRQENAGPTRRRRFDAVVHLRHRNTEKG